MPYGFYVFERYDLMQLAADLDQVLADVPPEDVVSVTHSSATDDQGVRYSALVVFQTR